MKKNHQLISNCAIGILLFSPILNSCSKKSNPSPSQLTFIVSNFAGSGNQGLNNGTGLAATFGFPNGICSDKNDNLYVADQDNFVIRKITSDGAVSTYAGTGQKGTHYANALTSTFDSPSLTVVDANGNLFISDEANLVIKKIAATGFVSVYAGSFIGRTDGPGGIATFGAIRGMTTDGNGNMFVTDQDVIRKITPQGIVSTFLKGGLLSSTLTGIGCDAAGNIYVANSNGNNILKITQDGVASVFAGGTTSGEKDGIGTAATFNFPGGLTVDSKGNVYVIEVYNKLIRMITPSGVVSTIAGGAGGTDQNGDGRLSSFKSPYGIAADSKGNLYVTDSYNYLVRKIALSTQN